MMRMGWNPQRTIFLCSWDAEEFGMIGSTEWVEQNLVNLGSKAVAYINVDCTVQGPGFFAATTPQLDDILVEVTKKVTDPDFSDSMLFEKWRTTNDGPLIQRLSDVFSDFAPFLHHAGVPSIDLYYGKDFPVYHTVFDSYEWMVKYGDPFFHRHVAVSGVWGLLGLHLADDPILPFNYNYTHSLESLLEWGVSLHPITSAIQELEDGAKQVQDEMKKMREEETEGRVSVLKRRMLNDRLMFAERGFLDSEGIQGRPWFKHLGSESPISYMGDQGCPSDERVIYCKHYNAHVKGFDHHCLAFGNFIGQNNRRLFMSLLAVFITLEACYILGASQILASSTGKVDWNESLAASTMIFCILQVIWQAVFSGVAHILRVFQYQNG